MHDDPGFQPPPKPAPSTADSGPRPERQTAIYCRSCGYTLVHLPAGRCPECGQHFNPEDLRTVSLTQPRATSETTRLALRFTRKAACWLVALFFLFAFVFAVLGCLFEATGGARPF